MFNELIDLKASHAALLAANNEITNELTALRNDVTSHLQTQSQRLTETNDLRDSHAALLVATNEIVNEVVNLRNDITSHFQKQSHISSYSQGWTSVGKNRRPIDFQNKFKALEVPDGEMSPKESDAKPDENSPLIINADRSTPMTLTDQLAEYRLQHKQNFISQSTTAISESSTEPSIGNSTVTALNSSKQVPVSTDKPTKACLIGDSLVKNIESRKLSRACRGKTIVECSRGAKIKDIHKKANEFLASGHIDGNTALIVHCGTNDLAVENEDAAATNLRMQPRSQGLFLFPGLGAGREKALASAGHVSILHPEILGVIACVASVSVAQRAKNGGFGVLPARKMGREQNRKEGGGGGEGRNRLRTNPWILKTSVRQRTELLIGWNRRLLLTCVDHRSYKVLLRARIQHGGRRGRLFRSVFAQSINFSRQSRI